MLYVLFDEESTWKSLLPLTFTRPVSELRVGIMTIREKWDAYLGTKCQYYTAEYLATKYVNPDPETEAILINSCLCPTQGLAEQIKTLKAGEAITAAGIIIALRGSINTLKAAFPLHKINYEGPVLCIKNVWDLFQKNADAINADFELLTKGRKSAELSSTVTVIGDRKNIFLEAGAKAEACFINATTGPVYLGADSEIMEGSMIRGPFALGEHSVIKMGAKIYGATTVGPYSKVGGEVSNSVITGYSNKTHDGFLGNSVIGEWCNLGADTNSSNLKNNYASVKLYNYLHQKTIDTGLQFCGLIMGDHSKSGINTMFNTGTVVGIACNIYGGGFPETHIPSFSWGGSDGFITHKPFKFFETVERVYERRNMKFVQADKDVLVSVFAITNGG